MENPRKDARARISDLLQSPDEQIATGGPSRRHASTPLERRHVTDKTKRQASSNLPTAADLFVPSLPGFPDLAQHPKHPLNIYAGLLPSDPGADAGGGDGSTGRNAELYFLMIKARRSAGKQRVVFWFNGGPGCSSFDGALMEVGPFRTIPKAQTESGQVEIKFVEGGWEEYAHIVYIDQPPGTGFSYVPTNGYLHELDQGSQHFRKFLENFYQVFPEMKGLDTYLAGESFAGQYIPYFADALIKAPVEGINLRGVAIGNGWTDPKNQYPAYAHFAYEKGLIKEGSAEANILEERLSRCMTEMEKYPDPMDTPININNCQAVMDAVTDPFTQELNGKRMCMNIYDVRLQDEYPACGMNWPPDLTEVYEFLRRDDVIKSLHAEKKDTAWVECNGRVGSELHLRHSTAAVAYLPGILESGVEVLLFVGAEDLICNYKGIEEMIENMSWSGNKGWGNSTLMSWSMNGTQVGQWAYTRNLTYAKIFDSSHMVGYDKPHVTNDMITRFMDVDFDLLPGMLASSNSKVGGLSRLAIGSVSTAAPGLALLKGGDTDWEAWYNAGSAFLILIILLSIVALYFYFRRKARQRRRAMALPNTYDDSAERVPLGAERVEMEDLEAAEEFELDEHGRKKRYRGHRKGKSKAMNDGDIGSDREHDKGNTVFALGDDDEDR